MLQDLLDRISVAEAHPEDGFSLEYFSGFFEGILESAGAPCGLVSYAKVQGFFQSPASARFHGNYQFGLPLHSLGVLKKAIELIPGFGFAGGHLDAGQERDLVVACLFHDLCKAGLYEVSTRNVKGEDGVWRKEPFYKVRDGAYAVGHGTESLRRISKVCSLSEPWEMAVAWHMGSFGLTSEENTQYMNACRAHREVLLLHTADMLQVSSGGA
jgi:hypothetical protein